MIMNRLYLSLFIGLCLAYGISAFADSSFIDYEAGTETIFYKDGSSLTGAAKKIHREIISQTPIYDDSELSEYVARVGHKILANSHHAGRDYHFFVLDDPGVNAFTPGHGLIYFNRGLLNLLTSEGQLAGVLAHEIGHNTGRHIARRKSKAIWGNIASVAASIATRSNAVGNTINLSNQARLSSFGRELELEADEYAAEYLYNSNYDPEEMIGVLGVLKDYENYSSGGSGGVSYHGLFSTHPRNDQRLKEVIKQAGNLPPGEAFRGREEWREVIDGVVVGPNYTGNKAADEERYSNKNLGITFVYPDTWTQTTSGPKIILKDPEETIQLQITTEKTKDRSQSSTDAITAKYPDDLTNVELIDAQATKDLGVIGERPNRRVGLIPIVRNTYHFLGLAKNNQLTADQDAALVKIIKSFRRITRADLPSSATKTITYTRLEPGETFADIAKRVGRVDGIPDMENYLRLLNGYFPKGEPEPGTFLKIVE